MAKTNILINNEAFNLMEFGEMSSIKGFVTEDTINREVLHWLEHAVSFGFLSQLVKHLR